MRIRALLLTPVFFVMGWIDVSGQNDPPPPPPPVRAAPGEAAGAVSPCPRIDVQSSGPRGIREGQPLMFIANLQGGDPKVSPQIIWSVNGASIKDGQETKKIEVDTAGAGAFREITAEVWVGGYSGECQTQGSATVRVIPPPAKSDEFGDIEPARENERLAAAAAVLGQVEDQLYILAYAGRTTPRGHAATALRRMRAQLMASGLDAGRIILVDGGFREEAAYELWTVPRGAEPPKPTPTVDRRQIVFPKTIVTPTKRPAKP